VAIHQLKEVAANNERLGCPAGIYLYEGAQRGLEMFFDNRSQSTAITASPLAI
jgi:hypothetical protein